MKFLVILISAFLVAAAPFSEQDVATATVEPSKREEEKKTWNCGLDMWPGIGQGATRRGMEFWTKRTASDNFQETTWGTVGKCRMAWCGGKVGFYLCVKKDFSDRPMFETERLGQQLWDTYIKCNGAPPSGQEKLKETAFQFWGEGYNILVMGNADCKKLGHDVFDTT